MKIIVMFFLLSITILTGCAHVLSDENGNLSVSSDNFDEIRDKNQFFLGKAVMLGGLIVNITNSEEGGEIEVIQYPLSDEGFPEESLGSRGRFLVTSPTPFEITRYPKGGHITVIGEVKTNRQRTTKWESSRIPVISIRKVHVWQPETVKKLPFTIPGTNLVDPYYFGHDSKLPKRPIGGKTDLW